MIDVKRINHATFETPDLERLIDYYTDVVGLSVLTRTAGRAVLVSRLSSISIVLNRGTAARISRIAFQVAPQADLRDMGRALSGEGIVSDIAGDDLPGIGECLTFQDPRGTVVDLFADVQPATDAPQPGAIAPMKLGHVAFMLPDIHPLVAFYQTILGFRVSDWQEDFFCFMRCGTDHHTINFATGRSSRMHHMAFELKDWAHVQVACDHLGRMNVPIIWGPGRHGISHNIFTYHRNPDDQIVELYTEMDQMLDEELGFFDPRPWHRDRPQRPKVWDRQSAALVWGPPQGPDHARQRNME